MRLQRSRGTRLYDRMGRLYITRVARLRGTKMTAMTTMYSILLEVMRWDEGLVILDVIEAEGVEQPMLCTEAAH